jgi:hypothetical protein
LFPGLAVLLSMNQLSGEFCSQTKDKSQTTSLNQPSITPHIARSGTAYLEIGCLRSWYTGWWVHRVDGECLLQFGGIAPSGIWCSAIELNKLSTKSCPCQHPHLHHRDDGQSERACPFQEGYVSKPGDFLQSGCSLHGILQNSVDYGGGVGGHCKDVCIFSTRPGYIYIPEYDILDAVQMIIANWTADMEETEQFPVLKIGHIVVLLWTYKYRAGIGCATPYCITPLLKLRVSVCLKPF